MKIHVHPHHFYFVLGLIFGTNLIMLAGTRLFHFYYYNLITGNWEQASNTKHVLIEFSLGTENTVATWYSSMLFLGVALLSLLNFLLQKKISLKDKNRFLSYGWLIFFSLFLLLSFDEIASMHERIGKLDELNPLKDKTYGWISILALPILGVGIYMLYFLFKKIRNSRWASYVGFFGILLFLSVPLHEFIELRAWNAAPEMDTWKRPAHLLLLEEGSELFGVTAMLIAVLIYGINTVNRNNSFPFKPFIDKVVDLKRKDCVIWLSIFSFFLLFIMIMLTRSEFLTAEGDIGRIRNWFPAASAAVCSLLVLCLYSAKKGNSSVTGNIHVFTAGFFLFLSAYYGGNLYIYFADPEGSLVKTFLLVLFCLPVIGIGFSQFRTFKKFHTKTGALLWTTLIVTSLIFSNGYAAGLAYVGFSILTICLTDHSFSSRDVTTNRKKNPMLNTENGMSSVTEIRNRKM